jgi:hypothetical protein
LAPHLKHILKNNLRCCAICFFAASVIGIYTVFSSTEGSFLPFCSYICRIVQDNQLLLVVVLRVFMHADATNIIDRFDWCFALQNSKLYEAIFPSTLE